MDGYRSPLHPLFLVQTCPSILVVFKWQNILNLLGIGLKNAKYSHNKPKNVDQPFKTKLCIHRNILRALFKKILYNGYFCKTWDLFFFFVKHHNSCTTVHKLFRFHFLSFFSLHGNDLTWTDPQLLDDSNVGLCVKSVSSCSLSWGCCVAKVESH